MLFQTPADAMDISGSDKSVLLHIVSRAKRTDRGWYSHMTVRTISNETGFGAATVHRCLGKLKQQEWIKVTPHGSAQELGKRPVNGYLFNVEKLLEVNGVTSEVTIESVEMLLRVSEPMKESIALAAWKVFKAGKIETLGIGDCRMLLSSSNKLLVNEEDKLQIGVRLVKLGGMA